MTINSRNFSSLDQWLINFDKSLKSIFQHTAISRSNPAQQVAHTILSVSEQEQSAALLRVNHAGEICAQALYQGRALTTRNSNTRSMLLTAAAEEIDHLAWCQTRLTELNSHPSYLNPIWYMGSFFIGLMFGLLPDQFNLGFVVATEQQVMRHLDNHLNKLSSEDLRSRAILEQMRADESHHATQALKSGGTILANSIQLAMKATAKIMTTTAYWI